MTHGATDDDEHQLLISHRFRYWQNVYLNPRYTKGRFEKKVTNILLFHRKSDRYTGEMQKTQKTVSQ